MNKSIKLTALLCFLASLSACGSDDDNDDDVVSPVTATYSVQVTNLTNNQPLSPAAFIMHSNGYSLFSDGAQASNALEVMAESGDTADLITEATNASQYIAHGTADGATAPRSSADAVTLQVSSDNVENLYLTMATMLVNTNDAFSSLNAVDISNMSAGDSMLWTLPTWDAGTELNSETSATIPGPAAGGTGYDATRDDIINRVRIHQGVVTSDDGLATSALDESHRFLNPSVQLTVTRTE